MKHNLIINIYTERRDGNMNFIENREKFLKRNNIDDRTAIVVDQTHGNKVINIDSSDYQKQQADAIITNRRDVILISRMSDCVPVVFLDPVEKVIASAHSGREGTFQNISGKTVEKMRQIHNSKPENILVEIGPSIGGCCYEVSQEMFDFVKENFGELFNTKGPNNRNIDLKGIVKKQLIEGGIHAENINDLNICTKCGDHNYFSYRKNPGEGNFASVVYLK